MISILLGLASALTWGAADFTGGLASRHTGAYRAVLFGEAVGILVLLPIPLSIHEPVPGARVWIYAALAGALGTLGLLLLYQALVEGKMSIAAPVSALMAAVLPVIIGSLTEGIPGPLTFVGFGFALTAVWLISQGPTGAGHILSHLSDLRLPLLAGVGFGSFFILIHTATRDATFWPMVASRAAGLLVTNLFLFFRRDSWSLPRAAWPTVAMNGVLDVGGNAFYILASQLGRLDVSAVVSSLYPGSTVLLAWLILKERLSRAQWLGVFVALIAIIMFTL